MISAQIELLGGTGRVHAKDGIQSGSEKPRFLRPKRFSGGTTLQHKGSLYFTRPTLANYCAARGDFEASVARVFDMVASGAEQHVADEPYVTGGVQKRWLIRRWQPSVPFTWRDCPRTEGNIQALFHGIDKPEGPEIRAANQDAQEGYLDEHKNSIMCRGPMLADDGASTIGSVILMDIPNMAAGRALLENMPFFKAGCYRDITFHRWRFGRVFDRYKL